MIHFSDVPFTWIYQNCMQPDRCNYPVKLCAKLHYLVVRFNDALGTLGMNMSEPICKYGCCCTDQCHPKFHQKWCEQNDQWKSSSRYQHLH